ncbi:MAG TPA: lysozyme inhibitor LprI family protein [Dyella sp.]|uniref:lysozyme inhibitor LprI family protein n=1 Tax=Dyella sp. TaxID=1869338 RepID=UPI002D13C82C|nr:lysozyme inhibitor LprI family protein [Dyella sp.]HTV85675.1 lysozyme inhibitor LprI family protein [Dyella sp.]
MLLIACAVQADQPPSDQQIVDRYCAKADTQADMNQCAQDAVSAADKELNATYQAVLKKWAAYPVMLDKLRQSQRQWLSYRDADLKARFAIEDGEGAERGTAYPAAYAFYQASLERERTARLCEYLRGTAYGERDSAPCAELVKHPLIVPNTH